MYCLCAQRFGITTGIPDKLPQWLPVIDTSHDAWNFQIDGRSLFHNGSETEFPGISYLHNLITGHSVGLLITTYGDLHLYIDRCHSEQIATGLPVDKPLWGAVDALNTCVKVESTILLDGTNLCVHMYSHIKVLLLIFLILWGFSVPIVFINNLLSIFNVCIHYWNEYSKSLLHCHYITYTV